MKKIVFIILAVIGLTLVLSSCFMSTPNISGTWMLTMIISANGQSNTSPITISQSGNSITVNLSGVNLAGTISGNSINFSGYQNDNGQYVVVNFCIKSCVK